MNVPEFRGEPLSTYHKLTSESATGIWQYTSRQIPRPGDMDTINDLTHQGFEPIGGDETTRGVLLACLFSQLYEVVSVQNGQEVSAWAHRDSIKAVQERPVILCFATPEGYTPTREIEQIEMLQFLPHPRMGELALVGARLFNCFDLDSAGQALYSAWKAALFQLAGPCEWPAYVGAHQFCASELVYNDLRAELLKISINSRGKPRKQAQEQLALLEASRKQVVELRESWLRPDWLLRWGEVRKMAQELVAHYGDLTKKQTRVTLPALTSGHHTLLPSNNAIRGIQESFGPALTKFSLWETELCEHEITTPNGARLRVRGQEPFERVALTQYLKEMIGVEGLKHFLILMETLYTQTGARDRRDDAHISLRQLLLRMGYDESKADDIEERRKLAHTVLYLARTWVTSNETVYEKEEGPKGGKRPGQRKRRRGVEWTPLLVIEKMKSSPDGGLDVPDEVKYHLGEDFYNSMFGPNGHFFTLPTLAVLNYHAQNEQQELCLVFYLTNMMFIETRFSIHFRELALQSGLLRADTMDRDNQRLRSAKRIVYALEQLERDELIKHNAHGALDMAVAVDFYTGECRSEDLAPATRQRIQKHYSYLQWCSPSDLQTKRRRALQHLLTTIEGDAIVFGPGAVLKARIEKREAQRQNAIARNEQTHRARLIQAGRKAIQQEVARIVDSIPPVSDEN